MNLRRDRGPAPYQGKDEKVREVQFRSFSSCFREWWGSVISFVLSLLILEPKYRPLLLPFHLLIY